MAIYAIGDLHLSLGGEKPMDIFSGWKDYVPRLEENWRALVKDEDTVVVAGDVSWAMTLAEAKADFAFLHALPGKKILLKGNHDYWWSTMNKMQSFLQEEGFSTLDILHNNAITCQGAQLCGSRGWLFEQGEAQDQKVLAREAMRLEASLKAAKGEGERIAFLHYPPIFGQQLSPEILDVLFRYQVKRCYYGHLHGPACHSAYQGEYVGVDFRLISADYLKFAPILVEK